MESPDHPLDPAQLLAILQFSDSMFPTGAFTHSAGLETYTQQSNLRDADGLRDLLTTRLLYGAARCDLIVVHSAMTAYQAQDRAVIVQLDEQLSALKTAKESREASTKVGRQLLRNGQMLLDDPLLADYQRAISEGRCAGHQAVVQGLIYAAMHIPPSTALLAFAYGIAAGQISAALKLMPIGQTRAQQVLHALIPTMQQAVEIALRCTADDIQSFTPALEIHAMQHQHLFRRLFTS